jgi:hypothetical protein
MEAKQLELPILTRPRVRLELVASEPDDLYSAWSFGTPPCDGWWHVTDRRTGGNIINDRWWFDGSHGAWKWFPAGPRGHRKQINGAFYVSEMLLHDEFLDGSYQWRGLRVPSGIVYPCPPYDSLALIKRAQDAGVSIATPYMRITPQARIRNRL